MHTHHKNVHMHVCAYQPSQGSNHDQSIQMQKNCISCLTYLFFEYLHAQWNLYLTDTLGPGARHPGTRGQTP